jgi:acyl-coenzyme A thioesterase PaaI-like protein
MTLGAPQPDRRAFSEVSKVVPAGPGCFEIDIDPEWTVGGKPNGGYLMAMMGRAAGWDSAHDHVIASSAHYMRAPDPGPAIIEVETLRAGRSASQLRTSLRQDDRACVVALLTTSHLESETKAYWNEGLPKMGTSGWDECEPLAPVLPNGKSIAIMQQIDIRLDRDTRGFASRRPSGRGELRGWLALPEGESFDPNALLFAVDSYPPATFDIEFSGWVPTLEMTVYVRALPVPGPVRIAQIARLIEAGRVDEACFVWDSAGRLVAQGTQLAGIRLG